MSQIRGLDQGVGRVDGWGFLQANGAVSDLLNGLERLPSRVGKCVNAHLARVRWEHADASTLQQRKIEQLRQHKRLWTCCV